MKSRGVVPARGKQPYNEIECSSPREKHEYRFIESERFDERMTRGETDEIYEFQQHFRRCACIRFLTRGATFCIAYITFLVSGLWRNRTSFCARAFGAQRSKVQAWTES